MKKLFLFSASLLMLCVSCTSDNTCTIQGAVTVPDTAKDFYAVMVCCNNDVDTCLVKNGTFTLKTVQNPRLQQRIRFIDAEGNEVGDGGLFDMMEIVADTRKMTVNFDNHTASGSPLTTAMNEMVLQVYQILEGPGSELDEMISASEAGDKEKMMEISIRTEQKMDSVLRTNYLAHLDDAVGLQAMTLMAFDLDYEEMVNLLDQGADFIKEDENIVMTLNYKLAPDKEDGKVVSVKVGPDGRVLSQVEQAASACSEYLNGAGRDGYVLLDFWASWCGPCREAIPEVIRLNNKFAPKGLKIIGITVKDKPEHSLAAMAELGIDYDQIFDLEGILCSYYPIAGIPHFFLLDSKGNIILQGHHNLEEFERYLLKNI